MATTSIILIILGFVLTVYAGVKLSLPSSVQTDGAVNQNKVFMFSVLITVATIMVLAGVLGYYFMQDNMPYYVGNAR